MARTPKATKPLEPRVPPYPHPENPNLTVVLAYKRSDGPIYESEELALQEQAEIDGYNANRGFLPWEYCECGCKGHELIVGENCYWCSMQLKPIRRYHLYIGHGITGKFLGTFHSWKGLDAALAPILRAAAEKHTKILETIKTWEKTRTA